MKKFLLPLSLAAVFFILCFTGCNNSAKNSDNDGWIEVQRITYYTQDGGKTFASACRWNYDLTDINKSEYEKAPEELKVKSDFIDSIDGTIGIDKQSYISELNQKKYKSFYYVNSSSDYKKITLNDYNLNFVKIRFFEDGSFLLNYDNIMNRIKPLSYIITYFND